MSIKKYSEFNEANIKVQGDLYLHSSKIKPLIDSSGSMKSINIRGLGGTILKDDIKTSGDRGMQIYQKMRKSYDSLDVGDRVFYNGKYHTLKNKVGECEIVDKSSPAHTQVKIRFDDGVTAWVEAYTLKKVTPKNKIKWYSKGKLHDEEGWANENKDFTNMPIIKNEKWTNLSFELEPLKDLEDLAGNLTSEQYAKFIIENVDKVFQNLLNRRVVIVAKKCIDQKRSMKDPLRWGSPSPQSITIYSYLPQQDGNLIIRANDGAGDIYLADLVECANNPDKYPILVRNVKMITPDDPYGEEEWDDDEK